MTRFDPCRLARWSGLLLLGALGTACPSVPVNDTPDPEPLISIDMTKLMDGDIIVHATADRDSRLIMTLTGSSWSHSGLIVQDGTDFNVIDNYPDRTGGSVQRTTVTEFCSHSTACGVWRYIPDRVVPAAASVWAKAQIGAGYSFDLLDPMTNNDKVQYCAEFVWRAYKAGGDDIIPTPIQLKGPNTATTRQRLIDFGRAEANALQRPFVAGKVDDVIRIHDGVIVSPGQLDGGNPKLVRVQ